MLKKILNIYFCAKLPLKEIRHCEAAEEDLPKEMKLNPAMDDIDRTSINGKAADIFLHRIPVKDVGRPKFHFTNTNNNVRYCLRQSVSKLPLSVSDF